MVIGWVFLNVGMEYNSVINVLFAAGHQQYDQNKDKHGSLVHHNGGLVLIHRLVLVAETECVVLDGACIWPPHNERDLARMSTHVEQHGKKD